MGKTNIEWASDVWNPLVGCSRVSEGCRHCYAERQAFRAGAMGIPQYEGITKKVGGEIRWTGEVRLVEDALELPLRWRKPRRIFVNSMSDLFHEKVPASVIDRIFAVMALAPHHTFQVLTKRPERMHDYFGNLTARALAVSAEMAIHHPDPTFVHSPVVRFSRPSSWPLPNVWLGVSVENQATADARIPLLLQTPAAVRWVSYEPALGAVDFAWALSRNRLDIGAGFLLRGSFAPGMETLRPLDWLVVGGESGPGARPFDLAWARQTIAQGRAAGVPVFVKQLGSAVIDPRLPAKPPWTYQEEPSAWKEWPMPKGWWCRPETGDHGPNLYDRKGGDPAEWPEDLRVREYPTPKGATR